MELSNMGSYLSENLYNWARAVNICPICRQPDLETGAWNKAILL